MIGVVEEWQTSGSWSMPPDCVGNACQYRADWSLDAESDMISFTVITNQSPDRWTGIAFAPGRINVRKNCTLYQAGIASHHNLGFFQFLFREERLLGGQLLLTILCIVWVMQRFGVGLVIEKLLFDSRPGRNQVN